MSLHKPRGASLVEYALVLFMFMGGTAAAVKGSGADVRDVFEQAANALPGNATARGQAEIDGTR